MFGADFGQADARFPVHVGLPRQRGERGEVVFPRLGLDPGEAIPAPDGPGRTLAQRAVVIVDADLRHGALQGAAVLIP